MPDKVFIDTNILVYSFLDNDQKRHEAAVHLLSSLLEKEVFISTQVMSKVYSALSKNRIQHETIASSLFELEEYRSSESWHSEKESFLEGELFVFLLGQPDVGFSSGK